MPELLTYFLGLGLGVALGMVLTCRDPREKSRGSSSPSMGDELSIAREKMRDYEEFIEPSIARMLEGAMLSFWAALAVDELVRQRAAAESALS